MSEISTTDDWGSVGRVSRCISEHECMWCVFRIGLINHPFIVRFR